MSGIDASVEALMRPLADALAALVFFPLPIAGAEVPLVVLWLVGSPLRISIIGTIVLSVVVGGIMAATNRRST